MGWGTWMVLGVHAIPGRVCARQRSNFSFAQKKSHQKKGAPTVCVPALSHWETCGARFGRGLAKLACGSDNASPDPPKAVLLGAYRGGPRGSGSVALCATSRLGREAVAVRLRRAGRIRARDCLRPKAEFERDPDQTEQRSVPGAPRRGDDFGSPFFGLRFFGEAKKGDCAAGRTPGRGCQWRLEVPKKLQAKSTASAGRTCASSYRITSKCYFAASIHSCAGSFLKTQKRFGPAITFR
ncbi:hypothetical protein SAMN05216303_1011041 [Rhodoferax sp. OV413]|nr:hypothetical protein SAMN05216303_1011041 [Rhodoferax sp. OV413]